MGLPEQEKSRLAAFYAQRVADQDRDRPGYKAAWQALTATILAAGGGDLVVPPLSPEPRPEALVAGLVVTPGEGAVFVEGEPNRCHGNAAALWLTDQATSIGTGYALSGDGLWRQHSWAYRQDGTIVETTELRDAYAGIVLDGFAALEFAAGNADPDVLLVAATSTAKVAALLRDLPRRG